jgi:hypothetical protein
MFYKRSSKLMFLLLSKYKMNLTEEQRVCVKFCFKLGKMAMETLQPLQTAYGEDDLSQTKCSGYCSSALKKAEHQLRRIKRWAGLQLPKTEKMLPASEISSMPIIS